MEIGGVSFGEMLGLDLMVSSPCMTGHVSA